MSGTAEEKNTIIRGRSAQESFTELTLGVGLNKAALKQEIDASQDMFDVLLKQDKSPVVLTNRRDLRGEFYFAMEKMDEDVDEGDLMRSQSFCLDKDGNEIDHHLSLEKNEEDNE
jgi:hypothetical protein